MICCRFYNPEKHCRQQTANRRRWCHQWQAGSCRHGWLSCV